MRLGRFFANFSLSLMFSTIIAVGQNNEVVLHSFDLTDGAAPQGTLIADAQQNLYGVTYAGGSGRCTYQFLPSGCGTVFELIRQPLGNWKETVLYSFQGGSDGSFPIAGLILDKAGNLYGNTSQGGSALNVGTVFELSPSSQPGGPWSESVLYSFAAVSDGAGPAGSLTFDQSGNLYGTTSGGGVECALGQCGTVFELSPPTQPGGTWSETIVHAFNFNPLQQHFDGAVPRAGVAFDPSGNLYGTTGAGGQGCDSGNGCGTVFQLKPPTQSGGPWTENVLYSFPGFGGPEGPVGNLLIARGALWGTASGEGDGYVFEIAPSSGGVTFTAIYSFQGGNDGGEPLGGWSPTPNLTSTALPLAAAPSTQERYLNYLLPANLAVHGRSKFYMPSPGSPISVTECFRMALSS